MADEMEIEIGEPGQGLVPRIEQTGGVVFDLVIGEQKVKDNVPRSMNATFLNEIVYLGRAEPTADEMSKRGYSAGTFLECPENFVSSIQFIVTRNVDTGVLTLTDKSRNGTSVNGTAVGLNSSVPLSEGDLIGILFKGTAKIQYRLGVTTTNIASVPAAAPEAELSAATLNKSVQPSSTSEICLEEAVVEAAAASEHCLQDSTTSKNLNVLQDQLKDLQSDNRNLEKRLEQANEEMVQLKSSLLSSQEEVRRLSVMVEHQDSKLLAAQSQQRESDSKLETKINEFNVLTVRHEALQREAATTKESLEKRNKHLDETNSAYVSEQSKREDVEQKKQLVLAANKVLTTNLEKAKNKAAAADKNIKVLSEALSKLEDFVKEEAARSRDKTKKRDQPISLYEKLQPLVQQIEDQMEERERNEALLAMESAERGELALKAFEEAKKLVATDATEGADDLPSNTPPTIAATASARSSAQRSGAGAYNNNSSSSSSRASSAKRARIDCTQVASSGFSDNEGDEDQQGEGAGTRRDEEEPGHDDDDDDVDDDADADTAADAHVDASDNDTNTRTTPMSGFKRRSSQQDAGNAEDAGDAEKGREQGKSGVNVHVPPEDSEQMQVQVQEQEQEQVQECDEDIVNQDKDKNHQENDSSQGNKLPQPKAISNSQQRLLEQDTPKGRGNNRLTKSQSHSQSQGNKSNDTARGKAFYSQDAGGTWMNVPIRHSHSHQQPVPAMVVVEDAEADINGAEEAQNNDSVASTSVTSIQEQHGQHLLGGDSFDH